MSQAAHTKKLNIEADLQGINEKIEQFRREGAALEPLKAEVLRLQGDRKKQVAQAMVSGTQADTAAIDLEIKKAQAAVERAESAAIAINLLSEQKKAADEQLLEIERTARIELVDTFPKLYASASDKRHAAKINLAEAESELRAAQELIQQIVQNNLLGKAEKAIKVCKETLLPELRKRIAEAPSMSELQTEGTSVMRSGENEKVPFNSKKRDETLKPIFETIENILKPAAATSEVCREVFSDESAKKGVLDILAELKQISLHAVRDKRMAVADWALGSTGYAQWTTDLQTAQDRNFVRNCGIGA